MERLPLIDAYLLAPLIRRWERRSALSAGDIRAIQSLPCARRTVERDGYVVREGNAPHECALLLSGCAYRHKLIRDGARQILSIHFPGEFVDLQNCMLGHADHSVQTLNRAEIAAVPTAALLDLASTNPASDARCGWTR